MKSPNLPKHGLYCVLRCPELCQIDGLVESDTELAIHAFGTDSEHYRTQILPNRAEIEQSRGLNSEIEQSRGEKSTNVPKSRSETRF